MKQICENEALCCGCSACENACPKHAIQMVADERGFLYPSINEELCVDCGKCVSICQAAKLLPPPAENEPDVYALQHKDKNVVKQSSSGGAFTLLSDLILSRGGVIAGCIIDEDFNVIHTIAEDVACRDRMRGSKYVQSDMRDIYSRVKELCQERPVLFVGTPCQVAGLNAFLGRPPENLITVDFLCHGTPSAQLLRDHVRFLEKRYRRSAASYKFRDKKYGWRHVESITFKDGSKKTNYNTFRLKHFFATNLNLRPSCYACQYTRCERPSDITIGDFWGAEAKIKNYENIGISFAMANTERGKALLKNVNNTAIFQTVTRTDILQRAMIKPAPRPSAVDRFWEDYKNGGYESVIQKYRAPRWKHHMRFGFVAFTVFMHLDKPINRLKNKIRGH